MLNRSQTGKIELTEITNTEIITLAEVKHLLGNGKPEEMDQIQRWTLDYVSKFSKVSHDDGKKLVQGLINECDLTEEEAVEVVNILPMTLEELRTFTFGWKKLILTSTLEKALEKIKLVHEA